MTQEDIRQVTEALRYKSLPEVEKIPIRIKIAKGIALEELAKGTDLTHALQWCLDNEQYCGAEGIKQALEEVELLKMLEAVEGSKKGY